MNTLKTTQDRQYKDAFQKSELAGRTMAGPVILKTKKAFSKSFWRKAISFVSVLFRIWLIWLDSFDKK